MAAPRGWTTEDDRKMRELHAAGASMHAIATELNRSKNTISLKSKAAGLVWDRAKTAAATQAVVVDNKARRARIVARMYGRMEHIQDRLEAATFKTTLKAMGGADEQMSLDFVPTSDERNLADTLSRYTASATKLEQIDAGDGSDTVRSLLGSLARTLGLAPEHDTAA